MRAIGWGVATALSRPRPRHLSTGVLWAHRATLGVGTHAGGRVCLGQLAQSRVVFIVEENPATSGAPTHVSDTETRQTSRSTAAADVPPQAILPQDARKPWACYFSRAESVAARTKTLKSGMGGKTENELDCTHTQGPMWLPSGSV